MKRTTIVLIYFILLSLFILPQFSIAQDRVVPSDHVTSHLNVRSEPNTNSERIGRLYPGESAEFLESVPYWYRVRLQDSTEGYVSKSWSQIITSSEDRVIRLGAWNIKKLGHGSSKDYPTVAGIINDNFDIVAVIEVMQKTLTHPGYDSLLAALGSGWFGMVTDLPRPNTTSGNSEYYAIIYRISHIRPCTGWTDLIYHTDNDGGDNSNAADYFSREPAYGCFEAPLNNNEIGIDFLIAGYHARFENNDTDAIKSEVRHLSEVFQSMATSKTGERDLIIAGDFNLIPSNLQEIFPNGDKTNGTGSTLNYSGERTGNLYDHLLVNDEGATSEMIGNAEVLDVRGEASSNQIFFQTVSDHLPIMVRMRASGPDDD